MNKETLETLLIDYIDGKLTHEEKLQVEQELVNNKDAYILYEQLKEVMHAMDRSSKLEPSASLQSSFNTLLQEEIKAVKKPKVIFLQPSFYRVAAAVTLLILGAGLGYWISKYQRQQQEIALIQKQLEENKLMMMSMLDNEGSASQRVLGATVALKMERPDDEIVMALGKAMNEDPNTNVRLAALDALSKFNKERHVRGILIASLATQKDPLVQIALIRILVEMKVQGAVKELERISNDEEVLKEVKDEAHAGLLKLS
ncbi:HEAT repeat domain-containing protein [Ohtaekwangia koreensis]|uniref:HEAT repeat-containing protein n=1 Tax=Ohtaekwangia koreensis TaxID=688867 RepID=A0A1T5MMI4_9BACT|nr:HEAT repeat domain-containing protein [Ohtaekwangia koreensis]SKC89079.1 HEAT repeat-containing protein [Ohtaekwangia koreensis]